MRNLEKGSGNKNTGKLKNAAENESADDKSASWWKPVLLAAVFGAIGWMANTVYTDYIVKPADRRVQKQAAAAAAVDSVKAELSKPLGNSLEFLRRVNMKGDPPDAVGHLVVSELRDFVKTADIDKDTKRLDMLPSGLQKEVLQLAEVLKSNVLIMSYQELRNYSTPDNVAILNKLQPEVHTLWVDLASVQ